jgi:hypothetical protein
MRLLAATGLTAALMMTACNDGETNPDDSFDEVQTTLADLEKWEECEVFVDSEGYVCEDFEGGTNYLMADMRFNDDGSLGGAFYWVLVANTPMSIHQNWSASGDAARGYCTVGFGLSGRWEEGGSTDCPDCTHRVIYSTTFAASLSNCPTDIQGDIRNTADGVVDASWYVKVNSDGSARGFDTQREWAPIGVGDDSGVIVHSEKKCVWLYEGICTRP